MASEKTKTDTLSTNGARDSDTTPVSNTRSLGQFNTPISICRLAASAAIRSGDLKVIDPTCGTGNMLVAATERFASLGIKGQVAGVELDQDVANIASQRVGGQSVRHGDLFTLLAERQLPLNNFDALIGNPPYVRYQNLSGAIGPTRLRVMDSLGRQKPKASVNRLADMSTRAALLAHLMESSASDEPDHFAAEYFELIHRDSQLLPEDRAWVRLVASYSGLADLSVPTWFAFILLVKPGGTLAIVSDDKGLSRQYGWYLRYAWLRWCVPQLEVVPANNSWFPDAQVPVALRVLRKRDSVDWPLDQIASSTPSIVRVELRNDVDLTDETAVRRLGRGARAHGNADYSRDLLERIVSDRGPWTRSSNNVQDRVEKLLRDATWLRSVPFDISADGDTSGCSNHRPERGQRRATDDEYLTLEDLGVSPRQGLRTGYNPFFYALRTHGGTVQLSEELGGVRLRLRAEHIRPALRYQTDRTPTQIVGSNQDWVALVTGGDLHPSDLDPYPPEWKVTWEKCGVARLPSPVIEWIDQGAKHSIRRHGELVPIRELSAVRPNERRPSLERNLQFDSPPPPKGWYGLRLASRHMAPVALGRIIHDRPRPLRNDVQEPCLIDANFSTFELGGTSMTSYGLIALLSSTWIWANLEADATVLGGGALKVEAIHLRQLPIPESVRHTFGELDAVGRSYVGADEYGKTNCIEDIDRLVTPGKLKLNKIKSRALKSRDARRRRARATARPES